MPARTRRYVIRFSILIVVVTLLVVLGVAQLGCAPADSEGGQSSEGGPTTVVYVTPALALTMDPCLIPGQQTAEILQNLYWEWTNYSLLPGPDDLMLDDTEGGEDALAPGVLESWELSPDEKVWTLHLTKGVKDNYGNSFTAQDMKWSLERTSNGPCQYISGLLGLTDIDEQVKVVDEDTVQVTLRHPNALFLRVMNANTGMPFGPEAQKHTTESDPWAFTWMKRNAPAIGPYMLEKWTPGVEQVLVRNPNWFGPKPEIDRIIYRAVPSGANRVALLQSGEAQLGRDFTQEEISKLSENPAVSVDCYAGNQFVYVALNVSQGNARMKNEKVRQALAYAVPYEDIIQTVYQDRAKRLYGMVTSSYSDYLGDEAYPYDTDYARATRLLAEAGFPNGFETSILVNADVPEHRRIAVLLADSFRQIGVTLSIDVKPSAAYNDAAFNRTYGDMVLAQSYAFVMDPNYHALAWLADQEPPNYNFGGFTDARLSEIMAQGQRTSGSERTELMKELQRVFNQKVPSLSIANAPTCFAFARNIEGYAWHTHNQIMFHELKVSG